MTIKNTYIICTRELNSNGEFLPEPGKTTFLKVPENLKKYTAKEIIPESKWKNLIISSADGVEDEITGSTGNILFFVHGYNNDIETVLWRTRELQETLISQGWKGLVVGFDWPSNNSTLNYLEDRYDASLVAHRLVNDALQIVIDAQFPTNSTTKACTINVHLLGHSTGAYVIMEAFANASKKGDLFKKPWRLGQVAFIAGDVSIDSLSSDSDWAKPMYERIFRLTNYSNHFDKVLSISNMKRFGTSPRAGRVGLPIEIPIKAINVNCSDYFKNKDPEKSRFVGTFNHSWHIGDNVFALDLAMTLEGEIDRQSIPTRININGQLNLIGGQSRPLYQKNWDMNSPLIS